MTISSRPPCLALVAMVTMVLALPLHADAYIYFIVGQPQPMMATYHDARKACESFNTRIPAYGEIERVTKFIRSRGVNRQAWLDDTQAGKYAFANDGQLYAFQSHFMVICRLPSEASILKTPSPLPLSYNEAIAACSAVLPGLSLVPRSKAKLVSAFLLNRGITASAWLADTLSPFIQTAYAVDGTQATPGRNMDERLQVVCMETDNSLWLPVPQSNSSQWLFIQGVGPTQLKPFTSFESAEQSCRHNLDLHASLLHWGDSLESRTLANRLAKDDTYWSWVKPQSSGDTRGMMLWVKDTQNPGNGLRMSYRASRHSHHALAWQNQQGLAICLVTCKVQENVRVFHPNRTYECKTDTHYRHSNAQVKCVDGYWTTDCRKISYASGTQVVRKPNTPNSYYTVHLDSSYNRVTTLTVFKAHEYCTAIHGTKSYGSAFRSGYPTIRHYDKFWLPGFGPSPTYYGGWNVFQRGNTLYQPDCRYGCPQHKATPVCDTECQSVQESQNAGNPGLSATNPDGSYSCSPGYMAPKDKQVFCMNRTLVAPCVRTDVTINGIKLKVFHGDGKPTQVHSPEECNHRGLQAIGHTCPGSLAAVRQLMREWRIEGVSLTPFVQMDASGYNQFRYLDEDGSSHVVGLYQPPRDLVCVSQC